MTVVCHVWPGITPWNIWDLPWVAWRGFAASADQWIEDNKKG